MGPEDLILRAFDIEAVFDREGAELPEHDRAIGIRTAYRGENGDAIYTTVILKNGCTPPQWKSLVKGAMEECYDLAVRPRSSRERRATKA